MNEFRLSMGEKRLACQNCRYKCENYTLSSALFYAREPNKIKPEERANPGRLYIHCSRYDPIDRLKRELELVR